MLRAFRGSGERAVARRRDVTNRAPWMAVALAAAALPTALTAQKPTRKPDQGGQPVVAPPVTPPTQPAAAGATSTGGFAATDSLADRAPAAAGQSVPALAAYLALAGPNETTRARAVYRWIAGHIDYDVRGFRSGSPGDVSPEGVLRSRSSVCEGYARLAEALGTAMGLQVQVVAGWSKGYGYTSGQHFDGPTNHAWNAVRIDGQWRLMDPTWGAGYLDQQSQFVRRFQEHYFLTAPEAFIFDHLPQDPQWQLLERPISAAEYENLVYLRPMFFLAGFRVGSHPHARIAADDRVTVTLGVTQAVQVAASVVDEASDRPFQDELTFVQVSASEARIDAVFPRAGDYLLRVFAKPLGADGSLSWVLDYRVRASRGASGAAFPMAFGSFGARGATLLEPLSGVLQAGRTYRFRLRAPGALDVAVVAGGRWAHLAASGGEFSGDVPVAAGSVVVYAKYEPTTEFTGLLRYTAH
jgi:hypothetical protein